MSTAITKIYAYLKEFPFLREHIPDDAFRSEESLFHVSHREMTAGFFLLRCTKKIDVNVYFYKKNRVSKVGKVCEGELGVESVGEAIERLWSSSPYYAVRIEGKVITVYIPPFDCDSDDLREYQYQVLATERTKSEQELKEDLAKLYGGKAQLRGVRPPKPWPKPPEPPKNRIIREGIDWKE